MASDAARRSQLAPPAGYRVLWLLYATKPEGPLPRRWRGLVSYGRLDIAARFLLASLYPGGSLLRDAALLLFLDAGRGEGEAIAFEPPCLPESASGEEEAAAMLLDALRGRLGCSSGPATLRGLVLGARRAGYRAVLLSEKGGSMKLRQDTDYLLIVGSRVDPPPSTPRDEAWSIGCLPYLASTVAAYINLKRRTRYMGETTRGA